MEFLSKLCVFLGWGAVLFGWLVVVVVAFKKNLLWGCGVLLVFPLEIVFTLLYWDEAQKGAFIQVGGFLSLLAGANLMPG